MANFVSLILILGFYKKREGIEFGSRGNEKPINSKC